MARSGHMAATWLRILCVIALVMLSFAHRPPEAVAAQLTAPELSAIALPDGSIPVICSSDEDGNTKTHVHASNQCEACRLSASVLLPEPSAQAGLIVSFAETMVFAKRIEAHYRQQIPPNANPRAPPASA